jgi:hypothetical protein
MNVACTPFIDGDLLHDALEQHRVVGAGHRIGRCCVDLDLAGPVLGVRRLDVDPRTEQCVAHLLEDASRWSASVSELYWMWDCTGCQSGPHR